MSAPERQTSSPETAAGSGVIHVFDGIEEQDNRLPNWWLGILWVTVAFALGYWLYFQTTGTGPSSQEEYRLELAELAKRAPPKVESDDASLLALAHSPSVEQGKTTFTTFCTPCHGAQGQGVIGPNLTDTYFLHGGKPTELMKVVDEGVAAKGMPAWGKMLGPQKLRTVTAYLLTLKGTNVPGGKPPQGEPSM